MSPFLLSFTDLMHCCFKGNCLNNIHPVRLRLTDFSDRQTEPEGYRHVQPSRTTLRL